MSLCIICVCCIWQRVFLRQCLLVLSRQHVLCSVCYACTGTHGHLMLRGLGYGSTTDNVTSSSSLSDSTSFTGKDWNVKLTYNLVYSRITAHWVWKFTKITIVTYNLVSNLIQFGSEIHIGTLWSLLSVCTYCTGATWLKLAIWHTHSTHTGIDVPWRARTRSFFIQVPAEGHSSCRLLPTTHLRRVLLRDSECSGVWWQPGAECSLLPSPVLTLRRAEAVADCWKYPHTTHAQLRAESAHVCLRKVVTCTQHHDNSSLLHRQSMFYLHTCIAITVF